MTITLSPGALDEVPLVALLKFLAEHGLELRQSGDDLVIEISLPRRSRSG